MNKNIRTINDVLDNIDKIVREYRNEILNSKKIVFLKDLKNIDEVIQYASPELINSSYFFEKLALILNYHISQKDYNNIEWCKKIIDIFTNN